MPTPTEVQAEIAAALDNAYHCYACENGDGFSDHDYRGAYDYREEGYRIGEAVFAHPVPAGEHVAAFREGRIEGECAAFPESAHRLIWKAAEFRMAELARAQKVAA